MIEVNGLLQSLVGGVVLYGRPCREGLYQGLKPGDVDPMIAGGVEPNRLSGDL